MYCAPYRSLEDPSRHITDSVRILVPVIKIKQSCRNVFSSRRNVSVDRSSFISVVSLFHARSAATEKALESWKLGYGALTEDFRVKFSSELVTSAPAALTDYS